METELKRMTQEEYEQIQPGEILTVYPEIIAYPHIPYTPILYFSGDVEAIEFVCQGTTLIVDPVDKVNNSTLRMFDIRHDELVSKFHNTTSEKEQISVPIPFDDDPSEAWEEYKKQVNKNKKLPPTWSTTDGKPLNQPEDHTGQYQNYIVLTEEERTKGFVRPLRRAYIHKGIRPEYPLRDLTEEEHKRYDKFGYVKYEKYPEDKYPSLGSFWTQEQLNSGCGTKTTMGLSLCETYARDPKFYGSTFCCGCNKHLPVKEFVWEEDGERVGS